MSALTSLLVRDQRVPVRKIEEAIQRQVISGGQLDTVLLEQGLVPENVMNAYLAAVHGLLPATREEVMRVPRDVIRLVPREIAVKHRLVPVSAEDRVLLVAVCEPLDAPLETQLAFLLGVEIVQRVVNECRLAAALHHHYDVQMPARMRRLAEKLRHEAPGAVPYVAPLEVNVAQRSTLADEDEYASDEPDPEGLDEEVRLTTKRFGVVADDAVPSEVVRVGTAQVVGAGLRASTRAPRPSPSPSPPPSSPRRIAEPRAELLARMRGPLTTRKAVELLADASDRDAILEVAFSFARQFFDYLVFFVVQEGDAEGLDAVGPGASHEEVWELAVPLDEPGAIAMVREGAVPLVTHLDQTESDRRLRAQLRRDEAMPAVLVPVAIRSRVVLIMLGDRSGADFGLADVPELLAFAPRVSEAFQRLILRRKFQGYVEGEARLEEPATPQPSPRSRTLRPSACLPEDLSRDPVPRANPSGPDAQQSSEPPPTASSAAAPEASSSEASSSEASSSGASSSEAVDDEPLPLVTRSVVRVDEASPAPQVATEAAPVPLPGESPSDPLADNGCDVLPKKKLRTRSMDVLGVPRSAPPPPKPGSQPEIVVGTPSVPLGPGGLDDEFDIGSEEEEDDDPEIEGAQEHDDDPEIEGDQEDDDDPEIEIEEASEEDPDFADTDFADDAPAGQYIFSGEIDEVRVRSRTPIDVVCLPGVTPTASPRTRSGRPPSEPPGSRSEPPGRPSVIIDMGDDVERLVADLKSIGPDDTSTVIASVVAFGEAALPVLVRDFPGPLWFDRHRPHRRLPRGRDISASARAMVSFGERAVPYVASLLDHDDLDVRFYATLLASEFVDERLIPPLGRRIFDEDRRTAALALDVLRSQRVHAGAFHKLLESVRAMARVPRRSAEQRARAVEALGELRDAAAVDLLIELLETNDELVVTVAHKALVLLTRQDFGRSRRRWEEWARTHGQQHRIEWLIEALLHPDEAMRSAACDELKQLTQEYYGYHPALPRRDREVAQRKYRRWWESEGHRRFR